MTERHMLQDLVVLFDSTCSAVAEEMSFDDFERLREGIRDLPARAGEPVRAAYVTVAPGLRIAGLVFFVLPFDPAGRVPDTFNIPLKYLAEHAGVRDDLGVGSVQVASRAQCPVPWVAIKLWEPEAAEDGPARLIQRTVVLNRLGLRSNPPLAPAIAEEPAREKRARWPGFGAPAPAVALQAPVQAPVVPDRSVESMRPATRPPAPARGPVHGDTSAIEQGYLEQIRKFRAELLELKAELRAERERNRRLQALLRGEI